LHLFKIMKIHNFSAGPSILPKSVIADASRAVKELDDILHNHVINHENYQQLSAMIIVQQKLRAYLGITLAPINIGD